MNQKGWPWNHAVNPDIYKERTDWPKISIVTPSYNQGQFIEETILSILNQNYPNLEYIIIDGGSTDNTVDIIKKYKDRITYWVSEKDNGQTHAINKGFEKATGEIYAYLNSDDCYYPFALFEVGQSYIQRITMGNKFLFIGNCYWAESLESQSGWLDKPNFPSSLFEALKKRGLAPQPSMFWTNPLKLKFYEELRFCMDFEFWLKLILNEYEVIRINKTLSLFRVHPSSKTSTLHQVLEEELNGISSLYKKHLSSEENIILTNFILEQIQLELYNKIKKFVNRPNFIDILYKYHLSLKLKFKALL